MAQRPICLLLGFRAARQIARVTSRWPPGLKGGDYAAIGVLFVSALADRPRMRILRNLRILRRFRVCPGARFRRFRRFRVRMSLRDPVKDIQVSMGAAHWLAAL